MRSRELGVVIRKDLAELFASRAFWLLLLFTGVLTGQSFTTAARQYAEASGPGALAQALSPLDGIVSPSMGAYDLAIMLLFPFVAIRMISAEKSSQAIKLMLQWPVSMATQIASKTIALLVAWLLALVPIVAAFALWKAYDGHLAAAETLNVIAGYTLRFLLTAALSMAAAALMPGAANAAVLVLAFTIGTWALDFLAIGRGGAIQALAQYTPTATLRSFERGLFRLDAALVFLIVAAALFVITALLLQPGVGRRLLVTRTLVVIIMAIVLAIGASQLPVTWDLAENRRNSFSPSDEKTLARIEEPLTISVRLAAEDPRMNDFENNVLVRLRRSVRNLSVAYPLGGKSALFDSDEHYGEITYTLGGKSVMSRSTTEEIVLDTIYELAGLPAPPQREENAYPGYPLVTTPANDGWIFYGVWPVIVLLAWRLSAARRSRRIG